MCFGKRGTTEQGVIARTRSTSVRQKVLVGAGVSAARSFHNTDKPIRPDKSAAPTTSGTTCRPSVPLVEIYHML